MVKRKHPRFLVKGDAIVAIQNGLNRIGKVKDVSLGGLSFEHIYDTELNWVDSRKNLFLWIDDFTLHKIPCRIVYDSPLSTPSEYESLTIQLITSRCGVEFKDLTDGQADRLNFFLKTYTKGQV
ncbi:MAG: PilZ domain-containing protein [Deltaproteobacteria bacterium]|nr:PilZ domain-containing protein [Deltaproteobacteria bacterium]MBM4322578.1 PilZ domain-containing protein [Deltaproteobacteria bacterium]MBM4347201.1 PilZ domain-containing protein [Deltaproteobacteria bacterium]